MNENTYKLCLRLTPQERAKLEADARCCSPPFGRTAYRGQQRRMTSCSTVAAKCYQCVHLWQRTLWYVLCQRRNER